MCNDDYADVALWLSEDSRLTLGIHKTHALLLSPATPRHSFYGLPDPHDSHFPLQVSLTSAPHSSGLRYIISGPWVPGILAPPPSEPLPALIFNPNLAVILPHCWRAKSRDHVSPVWCQVSIRHDGIETTFAEQTEI